MATPERKSELIGRLHELLSENGATIQSTCKRECTLQVRIGDEVIARFIDGQITGEDLGDS